MHHNSIHLYTGHCIHSHTALPLQPVHYHRWVDQTLKNASKLRTKQYKEYAKRLVNVNMDFHQHPANRSWKCLVKMDFRLGLVNLHNLLPAELSHFSQNFKPLSKRFLLITAGVSCVDRKWTVIIWSFLLSLHWSSILSCILPCLAESEDLKAKADGTGVDYWSSKIQTYFAAQSHKICENSHADSRKQLSFFLF